jgi:putative tricarboxylic transport membrane protein
MSPGSSPESETTQDVRPIDRAQYGLAAALAVVGIYTVVDARGLNVGFGDPVGPRVFPYVVGIAMVVLGVVLAVATARGDMAEGEEGEDVDLTTPIDWLTVGKLIGILVLNLLLVNILGWAITGALLFAGCAWALGSRTLLRDLIVGAVLSVASWYFFYVGLGVPLTPGILDGIL